MQQFFKRLTKTQLQAIRGGRAEVDSKSSKSSKSSESSKSSKTDGGTA
ncbi:MAG: hypothetical protein JKY65_19305 [Planctomycetes bacterium]|nr:hypothetical protein [Planctomycetota bacterium]